MTKLLMALTVGGIVYLSWFLLFLLLGQPRDFAAGYAWLAGCWAVMGSIVYHLLSWFADRRHNGA